MTLEPIFGRLKMFGLSITEIQTPIAPIVHRKMNTGKEFSSACIRFHVISARQVRFPSSPSIVRAPRAPSAFI
jgi:hypothetical protein